MTTQQERVARILVILAREMRRSAHNLPRLLLIVEVYGLLWQMGLTRCDEGGFHWDTRVAPVGTAPPRDPWF